MRGKNLDSTLYCVLCHCRALDLMCIRCDKGGVREV